VNSIGSSTVASRRGAYRNVTMSGSLPSTLKESAVKNCDTPLLASYGLEAAQKLGAHATGIAYRLDRMLYFVHRS
jgi:hypothetical protein